MQCFFKCLESNTKKNKNVILEKRANSFFYDLHDGQVSNEHQYIEKMSQSVTIGGLWRDFTSIFWIAEYLQRIVVNKYHTF
jgi:hypothetical protein